MSIFKNEIEVEVFVIYSMGGKRELKETGIYPMSLTLFSEKHDHKWSIKLKEETAEGNLVIDKSAFEFR